jgi:PBP1b-binding outer membrane lipoprotein LpoB
MLRIAAVAAIVLLASACSKGEEAPATDAAMTADTTAVDTTKMDTTATDTTSKKM